MNDLSRSHRSRHRVKVWFTNRFSGPVSLLWLNYSGQEVEYKVLQESDRLHVTTYGSHPWVARHTEGEGDNIFFQWAPEDKRGYFEAYRYFQHHFEAGILTRRQVESALVASYPLEVSLVPEYYQPVSLRQLVLRQLASLKLTEDSVKTLGLPEILEEELKVLLGG